MKHLLWIMLLVMLTTSGLAQNNLSQGETAYQQGAYAAAISAFEAAVDTGFQSAALHYNLGNAYLQTGDLGHAMLNFRRAARLAPRDTAIQTAIARVRAARSNAANEYTDPLLAVGTATNALLTLTELSWLVFGLWVAWFALATLYRLRRAGRDTLRVIWTTVGALLLIGLVLLGTRLYVETQQPPIVMLTPGTVAMNGPGDDYLRLFTLGEAIEGHAIERRGEWARITLPDGRQGWLPVENLGYIPSLG